MPNAMLKVRLTPRGAKNEVLGWDGETLRVKVTAPPVDGAANKACVELVAELIGVKRSLVSIVSGEKSRDKTLMVEGIDREGLGSRLAQL